MTGDLAALSSIENRKVVYAEEFLVEISKRMK
jgi:hypothetical protein